MDDVGDLEVWDGALPKEGHQYAPFMTTWAQKHTWKHLETKDNTPVYSVYISILEVRNLRGISQNLLPFVASIVTHRTSTDESQVRLHVPDFGSSPGAFAARNGRTPQGQDCWANRDGPVQTWWFSPKNGNFNEETSALEHDEHGNERWNGAASFQTNLTGSPSAWQSHCLKPV